MVLTSAPGGSDSIRNTSVAGLERKKSRLGIDIEQAARVKPQATTAITRLMAVSHPLRRQLPTDVPAEL
jgi:hypothetical protein